MMHRRIMMNIGQFGWALLPQKKTGLGYSGDVLVITADYYTDHTVQTLLISVDKESEHHDF